MKHSRIAALLLAALCISAAAVSCGDTEQNKPQNSTGPVNGNAETEAVTDVGYPAPDFGNMDCGGAKIRIIAPEWTTYVYAFTDALDGETVNDAAYTRIDNVENTLNVDIEYMWGQDTDTHKTVLQSVTAGDDAFDFVFTHSIYGISEYATTHSLYNLDEMPHLNFNAPWWNKNIIDTFRIGTETYYATGDIILTNPTSVFINKSIASDYDLPDHYDLVRNGKWTYDLFLTEAKSVSEDINGDGVIDENDKTGFAGDITEQLGNIPYACGESITRATDNGLELVFWSDKIVEIFNKTYDYFLDPIHSQAYFRHIRVGQTFDQNLALFTMTSVNSMPALREYDVDFGVLPMPKYDEAQAEYRTFMKPLFVCVPTTCTRPDTVGAALELFAYESTPVLSAYTEVLIRGKSTRDVDSLEMLNIIYNSICSDVGPSYLGFDTQYRKAFYCFYDLMSANNNNIASFYQSSEDAIKQVIEKLYDDIIAAQES